MSKTRPMFTEREKAMLAILRFLRSPLSMMSVPEREAAVAAAKAHDLKVEDLITFAIIDTRRNS